MTSTEPPIAVSAAKPIRTLMSFDLLVTIFHGVVVHVGASTAGKDAVPPRLSEGSGTEVPTLWLRSVTVPLAFCPALELCVVAIAAPPIMPEIAAQAAAAASVEANDVADCDVAVVPSSTEPSPTVPRPAVPSVLVPRLRPGLDAFSDGTVPAAPDEDVDCVDALDCEDAEEFARGTVVTPDMAAACDEPPSQGDNEMFWAAAVPWTAVARRLRPPPSKVGSAEPPDILEHWVEIAAGAEALVMLDCVPIVLGTPGLKGDVAGIVGNVGKLVCATPAPSPATVSPRKTAEVMKAFIPAISPLFGRPMASLGAPTAQAIEPNAMTSSADGPVRALGCKFAAAVHFHRINGDAR
jgi:hypothetical protein